MRLLLLLPLLMLVGCAEQSNDNKIVALKCYENVDEKEFLRIIDRKNNRWVRVEFNEETNRYKYVDSPLTVTSTEYIKKRKQGAIYVSWTPEIVDRRSLKFSIYKKGGNGATYVSHYAQCEIFPTPSSYSIYIKNQIEQEEEKARIKI